MKMLDGYDMNDVERRELVISLQGVVQHFVDIGFGDDPVSLALKAAKNEN